MKMKSNGMINKEKIEPNIDTISDQFGRIAIVTGANTGLGYETSLAMVKKGLKVVMACRNLSKAEAAKLRILSEVPNGELEILQVDLSKLESVHHAAEEFRNKHNTLDILVNNAGIMYPPYSKTEDGFESQMAANCFGHFLFTSLLIDLIPDSPDSRITWLSSLAHKTGRIHFDDINSEKEYSKLASYAQSKLACLMYALELDRKLKVAGKKIKSNAAHPGVSLTDLSRNTNKWVYQLMKYTIIPFITQSAADGALPILEASLSTTAEGGQYYGPQGFMEMRGCSGVGIIASHALDNDVSKNLWELSERLTKTNYLL